MKRILGAAFIGAMVTATSAAAQNCAQSGAAYETLTKVYQEHRIFVGATPDGLIEVWGNVETQSWTMLATTPNGVSCVLGDGVGFDTIAPGSPA